jgi:hypothetical protein
MIKPPLHPLTFNQKFRILYAAFVVRAVALIIQTTLSKYIIFAFFQPFSLSYFQHFLRLEPVCLVKKMVSPRFSGKFVQSVKLYFSIIRYYIKKCLLGTIRFRRDSEWHRVQVEGGAPR